MSLSESREVINFANSLGLRKAGNSGQYTYVKGIEKADIENMLEAYKKNQPLDENLRQKYAILLLHRYNENIMTSRIGLSKKGQYDPVNRRILEAITEILHVDPIINVEQLRDIMPAYNSIISEYTNGQSVNNRHERNSFVTQTSSRTPTTITPRRSTRLSLSPTQLKQTSQITQARQPTPARLAATIPLPAQSPQSDSSIVTGTSNISPQSQR